MILNTNEIAGPSQFLSDDKKEYILSKNNTAIRTLIRLSLHKAKKTNSKISIVVKKASKTIYWLYVLKDTNHMEKEKYKILYSVKFGKKRVMLVNTIKITKSKR